MQRTALADADQTALRAELVAALQRGELCVLPNPTKCNVCRETAEAAAEAAVPPREEQPLRTWFRKRTLFETMVCSQVAATGLAPRDAA